MHVMLILLKQEPLVRRIVSILIEMELFEASVLEGEGVEEAAAHAIPLFSSLQDLFGGEPAWRKIILTPVGDLQTVRDFLQVCRSEGIDFQKEGVGAVLAFPCPLYVSHEE